MRALFLVTCLDQELRYGEVRQIKLICDNQAAIILPQIQPFAREQNIEFD